MEYTPETTYSLTISVDDGSSGLNGGFDLEVDKGRFVNPGSESILPDDKEMHHSTSAAVTWTVDWTAPPAGSGQVSFTVVGMAINLDGSAGGDKWDLASYTVKEEGGVAQETMITMFTRFDAEQGERISVSGIISDVNGNPLSNLSVEFYRTTSYGQIKMGEAVSDSNGIVNISHRLSYSAINGSIVIEAVFKGTSEYEASSNIEDIAVSTEVESPIQPDFTVLTGFVFFIIVSVWVCIGYVVTLILKIKKESET